MTPSQKKMSRVTRSSGMNPSPNADVPKKKTTRRGKPNSNGPEKESRPEKESGREIAMHTLSPTASGTVAEERSSRGNELDQTNSERSCEITPQKNKRNSSQPSPVRPAKKLKDSSHVSTPTPLSTQVPREISSVESTPSRPATNYMSSPSVMTKYQGETHNRGIGRQLKLSSGALDQKMVKSIVERLDRLESQNEEIISLLRKGHQAGYDSENCTKSQIEVNDDNEFFLEPPKKRYERLMRTQLTNFDKVIRCEVLSGSILTVAMRKVFKSKKEKLLSGTELLKCIEVFMFCIEQRRGETNEKFRNGCGPQASMFRRAVVLECIGRIQNGDIKSVTHGEVIEQPFWLKLHERTGTVTTAYLYRDAIDVGIKRREITTKGGEVNQAKRRNQIGMKTLEATREDHCEFVGWSVYGQMVSVLHQGRRQAPLLIFEYMLYFFLPWSETNGKLSVSKKTLKLSWVSNDIEDDIDFESPEYTVNANLDDPKVDEENSVAYEKFVRDMTYLQITVEHGVMVNENKKNTTSRQRCGTTAMLWRRKVSLCDSAAQYLRGVSGSPRIGSSHEVLKYNKRSLQVIYLLAKAFRNLIECLHGEMFENRVVKNWDESEKETYGRIFKLLEPNDEERQRSLKRSIFSVPYEVWKAAHIPNPKEVTQNNKHCVKKGADLIDLLDDDEEDEGECDYSNAERTKDSSQCETNSVNEQMFLSSAQADDGDSVVYEDDDTDILPVY